MVTHTHTHTHAYSTIYSRDQLKLYHVSVFFFLCSPIFFPFISQWTIFKQQTNEIVFHFVVTELLIYLPSLGTVTWLQKKFISIHILALGKAPYHLFFVCVQTVDEIYKVASISLSPTVPGQIFVSRNPTVTFFCVIQGVEELGWVPYCIVCDFWFFLYVVIYIHGATSFL